MLLIPGCLISYFFTLGDVLSTILILSIILNNPVIKFAIFQALFQTKTSINNVPSTINEKSYYKIYENQRLWLGI